MGDLRFADVVEAGVRATLAAYTHALDDGRTDDVVATFCPDGAVDIPGMGTHEGHDALRAAYDGWKPRRPQRHLVVNTHVSEWDDDEAKATSDVVFLLKGKDAPGRSSSSAATTTSSTATGEHLAVPPPGGRVRL